MRKQIAATCLAALLATWAPIANGEVLRKWPDPSLSAVWQVHLIRNEISGHLSCFLDYYKFINHRSQWAVGVAFQERQFSIEATAEDAEPANNPTLTLEVGAHTWGPFKVDRGNLSPGGHAYAGATIPGSLVRPILSAVQTEAGAFTLHGDGMQHSGPLVGAGKAVDDFYDCINRMAGS